MYIGRILVVMFFRQTVIFIFLIVLPLSFSLYNILNLNCNCLNYPCFIDNFTDIHYLQVFNEHNIVFFSLF